MQPMKWADRQGNIPAGKSCLGWVDWTLGRLTQVTGLDTSCQTKKSYARFSPEQLWSFFLSPHLNKLVHSVLLFWSCLSLGKEPLLSLLLFPLHSLRNGGNVGFSISNNPKSKKERRNAGLWIHVTNGPNWCNAPNVRVFVWNQCLEQFTIWLMCP